MANFNHDLLIGYGLALAAVFCLASATACTQAVNGAIPITQILLGQFVFEVLLSLPLLVKERSLPKIKCERIFVVGALALVKFMVHVFFYLAPKFAPAGIVQAMFNTAGMLTCTMGDAIKKRGCTLTLFLPLLLCLAGIFLTSQPTFLGFRPVKDVTRYVSPCYHNGSVLNSSGVNISSGEMIYPSQYIPQSYEIPVGYAMSFIGGTFQGLGYIICVSYLSDVNPNTVNFWIGSINTVLSSVGLAIQRPVLLSGVKCWLLSTGSSLGDALGANLVNFAVLCIFPTAVAILLTLDIVVVSVFQYTILRHIHRGHENWEEYTGLVILTVANVLYPILSWRERRMGEYSNLEEQTNDSYELK